MFSVEQINQLLEVINKQNLTFIASKLGPEYLTTDEVERLRYYSINPYHLYNQSEDLALQMFHFGLISDAIGEFDAKKMKFENLLEYFKSGQFIPLTKTQHNTLNSIKKQFLGDIKANQGRVFQDINNIIGAKEKKNRNAYESVIRDEVLAGKLRRETSRQIASALALKTGDWSRNFNRIVEYVSHTALNEGRSAMLEDKFGNEVKVYFQVFAGACSSCIELYLTAGIGSQPRIFTLTQLKKNGSNIGRKKKEWRATITPIHPHCRCVLHKLDELYNWNPKTVSFDIPKKNAKQLLPKLNRMPIRVSVQIGDKKKDYVV